MRFDKHEVMGLLTEKGFSLIEENENAEHHFWFRFSSPTRMNHLAVMNRRKFPDMLKANLLDKDGVMMVTSVRPFIEGKIASVTFSDIQSFELLLEMVKKGAYVPIVPRKSLQPVQAWY